LPESFQLSMRLIGVNPLIQYENKRGLHEPTDYQDAHYILNFFFRDIKKIIFWAEDSTKQIEFFIVMRYPCVTFKTYNSSSANSKGGAKETRSILKMEESEFLN